MQAILTYNACHELAIVYYDSLARSCSTFANNNSTKQRKSV